MQIDKIEQILQIFLMDNFYEGWLQEEMAFAPSYC